MRDPTNSNGVSIYKVNVEDVENGENHEFTDLLNNSNIHILEQPNMGDFRKARMERDRTAMKVINPSIANHVLGKTSLGREEAAAVCIQSHFRGYLGRKEYVHLLYEQFEKDEAERLDKTQKQVEEGQIIVDNYHLKQEMDENDCLRRNRSRRENYSAVTIQRVWREYSTRMHSRLGDLKDENVGALKNGDSFAAASSFEDDFYEEDLFTNEEKNNSDEECEEKPCNLELQAQHTLSISLTSDNSESIDLNKELPPPSTDWESIDHRLNSNYLENSDSQYTPDPKVINRLSIGPDYLQLCFEDDNTLSDEGEIHSEEAEIKEYIIEDNRGIKTASEDTHDVRCLLKENSLNLEAVNVKIIKPEELKDTEITEEETTKVLRQLESVSERENNLGETEIFRKKLERFSIRHLQMQIRDLKLKIKDVSDELVGELLTRDQLHTKQDALLMDVEDAVKYAQTEHDKSKKSTK